VSTVCIYGKPADLPFNEDSEVGPLRFSEYAETKYQGDLIAWDLYHSRGLPLVMVYPGCVIGPGDDKASGRYVRDVAHGEQPATVLTDATLIFVHVSDVAEVILRALEHEDNLGEKYLVGKFQLSFGEMNELISEISGVPLPNLHLPDWLTMVNASLLTGIADLTGKPPLLPGMARDQIKTMKEGFVFDGSKAERELGITYTPVRVALEQAIASYQ